MDASLGMGETGTTPSELNGPLPRRARITGRGIMMRAMSAIFLAVGVAAAVWLGWRGKQLIEHRDALRRDGIEVQGRVTRAWSSGKSNSTHNVSYTFEANGAGYSGESQVPRAEFRNVWAARTLAIRYLPANPEVNHPAAWEEPDSSAWVPLIAPALLLTVSILLLYQLRLERQLILSGFPAIATVTRCSRRKSGWSIGFEFRTQTGIEARGVGWSAIARENGDRICVLYLPENPRRSQPYPVLNYRVGE